MSSFPQLTEAAVLDFLTSKNKQRFTSWQVAYKFGVSRKDAMPILKELEKKGSIISCVPGKDRVFFVDNKTELAVVDHQSKIRPFRELRGYAYMMRQVAERALAGR
ncbi:hypothetical protein [Collimonas humicola]|uniref:hypothetical protein n=1 Tax=Collimonas humicola TaxID=2825886 RepID=UPI001B8C1E8E|nr:hypothetical protein [Collimonas humicola]